MERRCICTAFLAFVLGVMCMTMPGQWTLAAETGGFTVLAQTDAASGEESSVLRDCQHKGLPLWNCECVLNEFRTARASDPGQGWNNLVAAIYADSCFDPDSIEAHYQGRACERRNRTQTALNNPQVDCACFGREMSQRIVQDKTTSHRAIGRLGIEAAAVCEVP